ncbi:hypothetical protein F7Q90_24125 [Pantoea stewartii subsp. stewartii]|nr:hypothetical protein F7Q90_24125 [Pantoea stewartii subsp. stewartii]
MCASFITKKFFKENKKRHKPRTRLLFSENKIISCFSFRALWPALRCFYPTLFLFNFAPLSARSGGHTCL